MRPTLTDKMLTLVSNEEEEEEDLVEGRLPLLLRHLVDRDLLHDQQLLVGVAAAEVHRPAEQPRNDRQSPRLTQPCNDRQSPRLTQPCNDRQSPRLTQPSSRAMTGSHQGSYSRAAAQ